MIYRLLPHLNVSFVQFAEIFDATLHRRSKRKNG